VNVLMISLSMKRVLLLSVLAASLGLAGFLAAGLIRGQTGGGTVRLETGPGGQPGPIDVGLPPVVSDDGPPVLVGPFRTVRMGFRDNTSSAALANADLVAATAAVSIAPEKLQGMASYADPAYLPDGYALESSSAVLGSVDVKSYEVHYRGPRGLEIIVSRIVGFTLPYDLDRPLEPPVGVTELTFGTVNGDAAAFYKVRPGEMGGEARIIIANDRYVTIVAGDIDGSGSTGTMTFDELLRVAESIR